MSELDSLILNYHDSLIYETDLYLLNEGNWLNDRVIGFVYEYFEKEVFPSECENNLLMFINPSTVQYLKLSDNLDEAKMCFLEPLELTKKEFLFFPLNSNTSTNAGGTHWSLLVLDNKNSTLKHYDSIGSNTNEAKHFFNKYKNYFGIKKYCHEDDFPKQSNSSDCGAYVLAATELVAELIKLGRHKDLNSIDYSLITPNYITDLRKKYKNLILLLSSIIE